MLVDSRGASWRNPRILATLLLIFMTGAVSGALVMRVKMQRPPDSTIPGTQITYSRLHSDLSLTPTQADAIRMILDDMSRYSLDLQTQVADYRATGKNRIRAVLTPDQKQQFEQMCQPSKTPR